MKRINIFTIILLFAFSFYADDMFAQRQRNRNFRGQQRGFWNQLDDVQKQELQDKIKELRDAGASWKDVQQEINGLLERYGIQLPENGRKRDGFVRFGRRPFFDLFKDLDETQKQAVLEKTKAELAEKHKNVILLNLISQNHLNLKMNILIL